MLVIANGAYKSGSTWLFRIVQALAEWRLPPEKYQRPGWGGTGLAPERLGQFLVDEDYVAHNYICKSHLFWKWPLVENRANVRILNITRDLRDVAVSAFHYERMKSRHTFDDFATYYWRRGRHTAHFVCHYNGLWSRPKNTFTANYEAFKTDFKKECSRVAEYLALPVDDDLLTRVQAATTLDEMRAKYDDISPDGTMRFYREGTIGQWKGLFDEKMQKDIERIQARHINYPNPLQVLLHRLRCKTRKPSDE